MEEERKQEVLGQEGYKPTLYRMLRVLEYTGTRAWIENCIKTRGVKGYIGFANASIKEAIIGETLEVATETRAIFIDTASDGVSLYGLVASIAHSLLDKGFIDSSCLSKAKGIIHQKLLIAIDEYRVKCSKVVGDNSKLRSEKI